MSREAVVAQIRPSTAPACGETGWSYSDLKVLGVAAARYQVHGAQWFHAALVYRRKKDVALFEMQTHNVVVERPVGPGFAWVEPKVDKDRLKLVIRRARLVREAAQSHGLPYGFTFGRSAFDENGIYRRAEGEVGLTCSTMIAAIFEAEKITLLDPGTWPAADEEDKRERRRLIAGIAQTDPEHARILTQEINAPRIRPQEVVAAAATFREKLGTFDNLQDGAIVVVDRTVPVAPPPRPNPAAPAPPAIAPPGGAPPAAG